MNAQQLSGLEILGRALSHPVIADTFSIRITAVEPGTVELSGTIKFSNRMEISGAALTDCTRLHEQGTSPRRIFPENTSRRKTLADETALFEKGLCVR